MLGNISLVSLPARGTGRRKAFLLHVIARVEQHMPSSAALLLQVEIVTQLETDPSEMLNEIIYSVRPVQSHPRALSYDVSHACARLLKGCTQLSVWQLDAAFYYHPLLTWHSDIETLATSVL